MAVKNMIPVPRADVMRQKAPGSPPNSDQESGTNEQEPVPTPAAVSLRPVARRYVRKPRRSARPVGQQKVSCPVPAGSDTDGSSSKKGKKRVRPSSISQCSNSDQRRASKRQHIYEGDDPEQLWASASEIEKKRAHQLIWFRFECQYSGSFWGSSDSSEGSGSDEVEMEDAGAQPDVSDTALVEAADLVVMASQKAWRFSRQGRAKNRVLDADYEQGNSQ